MSTTINPPATVPASSVIPFPTPWSGAPAGCCPPSGGLEQCYWEVKQAMSFMSALLVDLMNNDPNVQAAMVAGISKSGLPLPLIGVTNAAPAVAGQVGELFQNTVPNLPYGTVYTTQNVTLGILPAGDWLVWIWADTFTSVAQAVTGVFLPAPPTGFANITLGGQGPSQGTTIVSKPGQALISTATLMQMQFGVASSASGTFSANVLALRIR